MSEPIAQFDDYSRAPIVVDLTQKEGVARWAAVIDAEKRTAKALFKATLGSFPPASQALSPLFGLAYALYEGPYQGELQAWADAIGEDFSEVAMVNCAYDLDHLSDTLTAERVFETLKSAVLGCSSAVARLANEEMIQVRNLDWPIEGMGPSTRVFNFKKGSRDALFIGFPLFVGALSGMVPEAYSVTINWAPPQHLPVFSHHSPVFLLRQVLETCDTYDEAVAKLSSEKLTTSVFFTVCGVRPGEGCVIERTPTKPYRRSYEKGIPLVQTNHHDPQGEFKANNDVLTTNKELAADPLVKTTRERRKSLEDSLRGLAGKSWEELGPTGIFAALDVGEVTNKETCQRMIFRPSTGEWFLQTR